MKLFFLSESDRFTHKAAVIRAETWDEAVALFDRLPGLSSIGGEYSEDESLVQDGPAGVVAYQVWELGP